MDFSTSDAIFGCGFLFNTCFSMKFSLAIIEVDYSVIKTQFEGSHYMNS